MRFVVLVIFIAAVTAAFNYIPGATLAGSWPWLLILACPLMHLVMHRNHEPPRRQPVSPKGE